MTNIDHINLRKFDLNLMLAFDALLRERNVTRAARRVGIGQPAMSHALARMRRHLKDGLFVRSGAGMLPTPTALAFGDRVRVALTEVQAALLSPPDFDPGRAERTFTIGMPDYLELALMPHIMRILPAAAPGVSLRVRRTDRQRAPAYLDEETIDLAIGLFPKLSPKHEARVLFTETYACLFDGHSQRRRKPLTLKEYLASPHIRVSPHDIAMNEIHGPVDLRLADLGLHRQVVLTSPNYLVVPYILMGTNLVATMPARTARVCAEMFPLAIARVPFAAPKLDMMVIWHRRNGNDPAHRWIRGVIERAAHGLDSHTGKRLKSA